MHDVGKRPTGFFVLSAVAVIGVIACLASCSTTHPKSQPAEAAGIEDVSHVRRLLRAACGKLKDVNAGAANKAALMTEAKDLTASAAENWGCFLDYWGGRAPSDYVKHPDWDAATRELANGMADMLKRIEEDAAANAFNACGAACGKFVALNEQAGVRRTSDVLFSFRKAAKPLVEPVVKGDLDTVSAKVAQLREIRDKAMTDPVGGTGTSVQKAQALKAFSEAVDVFASAVRSGDKETLEALYWDMVSAMETAYDLFL
jgi:hypothetical protein